MSTPATPEAERLGSFFLGRRHDLANGQTHDEAVHYSAKDLTTHGVCVGMTGSGKTGLGVCLLEEAALDGIPALIVDPKGDMGNLLLQFPKLRAEDFLPWIDPDAAKRKELTPQELAQSTAEMWRKGLEQWGQTPERIERLVDAAEVAVFTPGSDAGIPVSILKSFDAPPSVVAQDRELFSERIQGATAGLLALLGMDADPLQSRETILISSILQAAWSEGKGLDIPGIIREIQSPPFDKLGVFDLDTFYPAKERLQLAMQINALLASPGFDMWVEGVPLDIEQLLYTPEGKPRLAVLSIAHLSETERMSFVTVLLNEILSWIRTQPGTSSLRAILYMDEIFGFFPPTKEPPSKRPMLTLLKQARAYGLGVILATQNPVDLDYKGLSNTGTWFLGRLQTERDKERVLDGLEGAVTGSGKGFDRRSMDRALSGLGKRVFLLHNVHEEAPVVFHTRWALSYLRGPMTRDEIRRKMEHHPLRGHEEEEIAVETESIPIRADAANAPDAAAASMAGAQEPTREDPLRPSLPEEISERFLLARRGAPDEARIVYRPLMAAEANLHYSRSSVGLEEWRTVGVTVSLVEREDGPQFDTLRTIDGGLGEGWDDEPTENASFGSCPSEVSQARRWKSWAKELEAVLYRERPTIIWRCKKPKLASRFAETRTEFEARLGQELRDELDQEQAKLKQRYGSKITTQEERVRRSQDKLAVQEEQYSSKKRSSWIDIGTNILGALFSKKKASSTNARRAGSAAKSINRAAREKEDVERAQEDLDVQEVKLRDLKADLEAALRSAEDEHALSQVEIEEVVITPRKGDLDATGLSLLWVPFAVAADGSSESLV